MPFFHFIYSLSIFSQLVIRILVILMLHLQILLRVK